MGIFRESRVNRSIFEPESRDRIIISISLLLDSFLIPILEFDKFSGKSQIQRADGEKD